MKTIIVTLLLLIPIQLFAATDCRIIEYTDHYLAECIGDEKAIPLPLQSSSMVQQTMPASSQNEGKQVDRQPQPASLTYSAATTSVAAQNASIKSPDGVQNGQPVQRQVVLSKRNIAKIEAAQMKELKYKAQVESGQ